MMKSDERADRCVQRNMATPSQQPDEEPNAEPGHYAANGTFVTEEQVLDTSSPLYIGKISTDNRALGQIGLTELQEEDLEAQRSPMEGMARRTPRFLFRSWNGVPATHPYAGLETEHDITPLAYSKGLGPASIHDVPHRLLISLAANHCHYAHVNSVFSSWSQSLAMVLPGAWAAASRRGYVRVIDTTLLPNIVLETKELHSFDDSISCEEHEFLAFGVICGEVHRAVRISDLLDAILDTNFDALLRGDGNGLDLDKALRVGSLFGDVFKLPMTAYFLALSPRPRSLDDLVDPLCAAFREVPEEWRADPNIMEVGHAHTARSLDAAQGAELLRAVVHRRYGTAEGEGEDPVSRETAASGKEPAEFIGGGTAASEAQATAPDDTTVVESEAVTEKQVSAPDDMMEPGGQSASQAGRLPHRPSACRRW